MISYLRIIPMARGLVGSNYFILYFFLYFMLLTLSICQITTYTTGAPDRSYYFPIGFNMASYYQGPSVSNYLAIDSQTTNFISPCQFMHPITIQFIGMYPNCNETPIKSIECDLNVLKSNLQFSLSYNFLYDACNMLANILKNSTTSYANFDGANNITIWLEGSKLESIVSKINENIPSNIPTILPSNVEYQFDQTIFGNNINSSIGIGSYLFKTISFPFLVSVEYSSIMPGVNSYGTNVPYIRFSMNLSLSLEQYDQKVSLSSLWTPIYGFGGYFPLMIPNDKFPNSVIYTTFTNISMSDSFVAWGNINIPLTSPLIRLIPPSRIPNTSINCTSNFDFYYPSIITPNGEVNEYPKSLSSLLKNETNEFIIRNTISGQSYWNKIPFGANWYTVGFPVSSPNCQWIETGNYLGGCYYNGTFPLAPNTLNKGFKDTLCSQQVQNTSDVYMSAFYPQPLEFVGYGVSDSQTLISGLYHYGMLKSEKNIEGILQDSDTVYFGNYPFYHLVANTAPVQITSPTPRLNAPLVQYSGRNLEIGDPFFNFNFQYMQDRFGHCAEPNECWQCSNPRIIPWKVKPIDQQNFIEFCTSNITEINNSEISQFKYYYGEFDDTVSKQQENGVSSCIISEPNRWIPVVKNATNFTLEAGNYYTDRIFIYYSISNDTCCSPLNAFVFFQYYYTIVTSEYQPIQLTQIVPYTDPFVGAILPGIFMNRGFSYSFYIDVFPDNIWTENSLLILKSWLLCPNISNIELEIYPKNVKISDILSIGGKLGASIYIPPYTMQTYYYKPTFCVMRAAIFVNETVALAKTSYFETMSFEKYKNETVKVYSSDEGIHEYVEWLLVNNGFISFGSKVLEPNPGNTSITDAIYTAVNVSHQYNFTISPFLFNAIALNTPVFTPDSQVFEMIIGGQHNRFGLRLPATQPQWYVYLRNTDKWDQGCFVPCKGDMSRTPYFQWCIPKNNSEAYNYNICNYTVIKTSIFDSQSQIEDAIAVVTSPISYLSYVDTMSLVNALFSQPLSVDIIWNDYFDIIYQYAIENNNIPFNQDYPFAQPITLSVINRILSTSYYNPASYINTSLPFNSIRRIYNTIECFLIDGINNLVMNTTDLLIITNPFTITKEKYKIIFDIYQSIAARRSYVQGVNNKFEFFIEKSGMSIFSYTYNQLDLNKGVSIGGIKFPKIDISQFSNYYFQLYNGTYFQENPEWYNISASAQGLELCTKSHLTITIVKANNYLTNFFISKVNNTISNYPLILSTIVLCTIEFEVWDLSDSLEFSFYSYWNTTLDYSNIKCAAKDRITNNLNTKHCKTKLFFNSMDQKVEFKCFCNAITYFGLVGSLQSFSTETLDKEILSYNNVPNTIQPFMSIAYSMINSFCNDWIPINIQLHNIPKSILNIQPKLNFECILPDQIYSSNEFCISIANLLKNSTNSYSRIGTNVNITYFLLPSLLNKKLLPINSHLWRPDNATFNNLEFKGVSVFLNISVIWDKYDGHTVFSLYNNLLFDIFMTETKTFNNSLLSMYFKNSYIKAPNIYLNGNLPIVSMIPSIVPFSMSSTSSKLCKMEASLLSNNPEITYFFSKINNLHINNSAPNYSLDIGATECTANINNTMMQTIEILNCSKGNDKSHNNLIFQNPIYGPISLLKIDTSLASNTIKISQNSIILNSEIITPNIKASLPTVISSEYPLLNVNVGRSLTFDQQMISFGYCSSISTGCNSCRWTSSYQPAFQFLNSKFKYFCATTKESNEIEAISQGLLNTCLEDGSYWGKACSKSQTNSTLLGNYTDVIIETIPQDSLYYLVLSIGLTDTKRNVTGCKSFVVKSVPDLLPFIIISQQVSETISLGHNSFINFQIRHTNNPLWNNMVIRNFAYAYIPSIGYIPLKVYPNKFNLTKLEVINTQRIDISIYLNFTSLSINTNTFQYATVLFIMLREDIDYFGESNLTIIMEQTELQNLLGINGYVAYTWKDIPVLNFNNGTELKVLSAPFGTSAVPLKYNITSYSDKVIFRYSLLIMDSPILNNSTNTILLSYLSSDIPDFVRFPSLSSNWKVYLIIHDKTNYPLCRIECETEIFGNKHYSRMFCLGGNVPICPYDLIKNQNLNPNEFQKDTTIQDLVLMKKYFTSKIMGFNSFDQVMIGAIISNNLNIYSLDQIQDIAKTWISQYIPKIYHDISTSYINLLSIISIIKYIISLGKVTTLFKWWSQEEINKLVLKSECGYNYDYPHLVTELLDYVIAFNLAQNYTNIVSLLGCASVNQWSLRNPLNTSISLNGNKSGVSINAEIFSYINLLKGVNTSHGMYISSIDFSGDINLLNPVFTKNIFYTINEEVTGYNKTWSSSLFSQCNDIRYTIISIKAPYQSYINELIQYDKTNNNIDKYFTIMQSYISRCGNEFQLFNLKNNLTLTIDPKYVPKVLPSGLVSYSCAVKSDSGIWLTENCITQQNSDILTCQCNVLGTYGVSIKKQQYLSNLSITLSHNPGSMQYVQVNQNSFKIINGKFLYNNQEVMSIPIQKDIIINPSGLSVDGLPVPINNSNIFLNVTSFSIRQNGIFGTIAIKSDEFNGTLKGPNFLRNNLYSSYYDQNQTLVII